MGRSFRQGTAFIDLIEVGRNGTVNRQPVVDRPVKVRGRVGSVLVMKHYELDRTCTDPPVCSPAPTDVRL